MSAEARLKGLGIALPPAAKPIANYMPFRRAGPLLFFSGQGPREVDDTLLTGKVGGPVSVEETYRRARLTGLALLALVR